MTKTVKVIFRGRVQGVFFRQHCKQEAFRLGLVGYVKNLDDGSVELVVSGEDSQIKRLVEYCKHEQPHAMVEKFIVEEIVDEETFKEFEIKY